MRKLHEARSGNDSSPVLPTATGSQCQQHRGQLKRAKLPKHRLFSSFAKQPNLTEAHTNRTVVALTYRRPVTGGTIGRTDNTA